MSEVLHEVAGVDPETPDFAAFPTRGAVYLMRDAAGRPVQLVCVGNLRASLKRRLGEPEAPSKRVDYRAVVREVAWRRVDSPLEADLVYLEAARRWFPEQYAGWLGFRPAWWVHVNPRTRYPRFTKTSEPTLKTGRYFGPLGDKHDAQKLVHAVEELFSLCRDYTYLQNAPAAACNWKQMGKCVGPCDGSVGLREYGRLVAAAADALGDPASAAFAAENDMRQAAADLDFERAERLKGRAARLGELRKGPRQHVGRLADFAWLALAAGPREGTAKLFVSTPRRFFEAAGLLDEPRRASALLRHALALAEDRNRPTEAAHVERVGLLTHHLTLPAKKRSAVILRADEVTEDTLRRAFKKVSVKTVAETSDEAATREVGV